MTRDIYTEPDDFDLGRPDSFHHVDKNQLRRVAAPPPNPAAPSASR
jgi:hypothetical protein